MAETNLKKKFEEKVEELEKTLPTLNKGVNCAELTLTNILDVLGIQDPIINNLAIPLAGGFGGYKSEKGWQGACGAVCGGCAAIGVVMGGKKRMPNSLIGMAYLKAAKYATEFEKKFGSVVCADLCGYDFSTPEGYLGYEESGTWEKKCYKYVKWGVEKVGKMTRQYLKKNWE